MESWLGVLLLWAKLSSFFYKTLAFLHSSYTFEQYLSFDWRNLALSSTFFTMSILNCLTFFLAWLASSLYWQDLSFSQITLSDKTIFSFQRLKKEFISPKIASNYSNVNFLTVDRNSFLVIRTDNSFQVYLFKSVICVLGSKLPFSIFFKITI